MTRETHQITRDEVMPMDAYVAVRVDRRREASAIKKNRRVSVGPFATFYFENYDTMWLQIHEMLFIEKGGEAQIDDELAAYNPLIPKGKELVATLMFEVDDPARRDCELRRLTHVERTVSLKIGEDVVAATAEIDVERTKDDGKTSSIHFLRFGLADRHTTGFAETDVPVVLQIEHENYGHMAAMPTNVRAALIEDFD